MWTLLTSTSKLSADNTSVTTDAIDTTGAKLLIAASFFEWPANPDQDTSFNDSKGNTWQVLTEYRESGTGIAVRIRYVFNPTVGSGHTFNVATGGEQIFPALGILAFTGTGTLFFDAENGATAAGTTTLQTGSASKSSSRTNALYIAVGNSSSTGTSLSIDSGFTVLFDVVSISTSDGVHVTYKTTTSASENPTFTCSPVSRMRSAAIAVFTDSGEASSEILKPQPLRPAIFSPGFAR